MGLHSNSMKICFLFGSGISVPAGISHVGKLTELVLSKDKYYLYGGSFHKKRRDWPTPPLSDILAKDTAPVREFLKWLKLQAEARFEQKPKVRYANYEDLAYLVAQIVDDCLDEYENPALLKFVDAAKEFARPLILNSSRDFIK